MAVSFNQVPADALVPFTYVEIDPSRAGSSGAAFRGLLIGQRLSAGTVAAEVPVPIGSGLDGRAKFGAGSMLAVMIAAYRRQNPDRPALGGCARRCGRCRAGHDHGHGILGSDGSGRHRALHRRSPYPGHAHRRDHNRSHRDRHRHGGQGSGRRHRRSAASVIRSGWLCRDAHEPQRRRVIRHRRAPLLPARRRPARRCGDRHLRRNGRRDRPGHPGRA